jgi:hypothetical protein
LGKRTPLKILELETEVDRVALLGYFISGVIRWGRGKINRRAKGWRVGGGLTRCSEKRDPEGGVPMPW